MRWLRSLAVHEQGISHAWRSSAWDILGAEDASKFRPGRCLRSHYKKQISKLVVIQTTIFLTFLTDGEQAKSAVWCASTLTGMALIVRSGKLLDVNDANMRRDTAPTPWNHIVCSRHCLLDRQLLIQLINSILVHFVLSNEVVKTTVTSATIGPFVCINENARRLGREVL